METLFLSLDPCHNDTRMSTSYQSMREWHVAILIIDEKLGDPSNALEKVLLSLETCKSTDKWY